MNSRLAICGPWPRQLILVCLAALSLAACQVNSELPPPGEGAVAEAPEPATLPRRSLPPPTPTREVQAETEEPVDLWQRLREGLLLSDYYDHPRVIEARADYASDPALYALFSERAAPFLFGIVGELERREMPLELALLPVIESTYNPNAASREGAVGLWQFVSNTGRRYGLQQDWWYDGRRDPLASTVAAMDYMSLLNDRFDGDWLLTMAAYNTGSANVRRAIRRSGQDPAAVDFWSLPLAVETRNHIPRLLALASIVQNPELLDIELPPLPNSNPLTTVEIGSQIDLGQAAGLAEIDYETLRFLNAGYQRWATHPDSPQHLYLPHDAAQRLRAQLQTVDVASLMTWDRYEIRPGDSLGAIARRFDTEVEVLQRVNSLRGSRIIAGDSLLIPRGEIDDTAINLPALASETAVEVPSSYTVRRGDNLWQIARRYNLRSAEIAAHNNLSLDTLLMPGQRLDLSYAENTTAITLNAGDSADHYRVRPGDTLGVIAERFGLRLESLLRWNQLRGSDTIYPGQELRVTPSGAAE